MMAFHEQDFEFARVDGGRELIGRLYRPEREDPFPLLVDVHGGAWVTGNRLNNAVIHRALAGFGIGIFALDFRMPPEARFPAAVRDVNAGLRWVFANAKALGSTPALIGGLGTSSGAHLLMMNALRPDDKEYALPESGSTIDMRYVIAGWPILDPLARFRMAAARGLVKLVNAHREFWPDETAMARVNPQLIVDRGNQQQLPRVLILQGNADENVEPSRAEVFATAYRAVGGEIQVEMFAGQPHAFMLSKTDSPVFQAAISHMVRFVRSVPGR